MLKAEGIYKAYNGEDVLKDVALEVEDGEFVVILGASGSGKSTLLSVLSGLERADKGRVSYDERDITALNDKQLTAFRRDTVGFVFQQYYLLSNLDVENNVRLGASLVGNKNYREIIADVGLGEKIKSMPSELSGGEQQRVAIARAVAKNPLLLLCDEPTGALDYKTGKMVLKLLENVNTDYKKTVVLITHNSAIAPMADKVIHVRSGRVEKIELNEKRVSVDDIEW